MRRGSDELLRVPDAALVRALAPAGGLHRDEPREQPRVRLRRRRPARRRSTRSRGVGLEWTGRPGQITVQKVGGIRVALVGFAPYPWAQSLTDIAAAKKLVRKAARSADVVVVTMHAGAEGSDRQHVQRGHASCFLGENRGDSMRFAHAVVDAGADLVVGSGPHVLRGMEWYKGRLIAYSLGNFAGYKVFSLGGPLSTSGILRVTLRGDGKFEAGRLVPTHLVGRRPACDRPGRGGTRRRQDALPRGLRRARP